MKINLGGIRKGMKVTASLERKKRFSKTLKLGEEYCLLFPKTGNDITSNGIITRATNMDAVGMSFVRIPNEMLEVDVETGVPVDKSGLNRWATIGNILYEAQFAMDLANKKEELEKAARLTGTPVDQLTLQQSIDQIDVQYHGRKGDNGQKDILPDKKRLIAFKALPTQFTQCLVIPLDAEKKPIWKDAQAAEIDLSSARLKTLFSFLDQPAYNDQNDPDGFLEVRFAYLGATTKEAGQNKFVGVEPTARKFNPALNEDGTFVAKEQEIMHDKLRSISHSNEQIYASSSTVAYAKGPAEFEAAVRKYLLNNPLMAAYIDMSSEEVQKAAGLLKDFGIFRTDSKQYKELLEIIAEHPDAAPDAVDQLSAGAVAVANATSIKEVQAVVNSNPEAGSAFEESDGLGDL